MAFLYNNPLGIKMTEADEHLLEAIDSFPYSFGGYANLGELHSKISVILFGKTDPRPFKYIITNKQREDTLSIINQQIDKAKIYYKLKAEALEKQRKGENGVDLMNEGWRLENLCQRLGWQKEIYQKAVLLPDGNYQIEGDIMVFGEYANQELKLYYHEFSPYAKYRNKDNQKWLAAVYVHEMMRACFDIEKGHANEIEEPMVESAMLSFFEQYDNSFFEYAKQIVEEKQTSSVIACYKFGPYVFKGPLYDIDRLKELRI